MAARPRLEWASLAGTECLRVRGLELAHRLPALRVFPTETLTTASAGALPAMAGRVVAADDSLWFVPRFPFVDGTSYSVVLDGAEADALAIVRPARSVAAEVEVVAIHPTAAMVPRNLLRLYVWFSGAMSPGRAHEHVRLVDDTTAAPLAGALFTMEDELWDAARRRLTVLLDPARIKRGLAPHQEVGYPLEIGRRVRLVVDGELRDAAGRQLRSAAERTYEVGADLRGRVDPSAWVLAAPPAGTTEPVTVHFDRPLDDGLLRHCLHVHGPGGTAVAGEASIGPGGTSWRFVPSTPWVAGDHTLRIDPILEDVSGNSVVRVFDRDLGRREDDPLAGPPPPVSIRISP